MKEELKLYYIADFEKKNFKQPVILYENGSVEIPSLLSMKSYLGKQYYDGIETNLARLKYRKRDLRNSFRPMDRPVYFYEVLEKIRDKKNISISKLWNFFYKNEIERIISAVLRGIVERRINRLISQAFRKRPRDDEFLKKIGYIN